MEISDPQSLQQMLRDAIASKNASPPQLHALGAALHAAAQPEAALRAFELACEGAPDEVDHWLANATLKLQLNLPQGALAACNRALQCAPENVECLYSAGVVLATLGETAAALHCYDKVLAHAPQHYGALRNRPMLLAALGRNTQAREAADEALHLFPQDPWLYYNLGELLLGMRSAADAIAAFKQALALEPDFHQARYAYALALAADGHVRVACAEQQHALAAEPALSLTYRSPLVLDSLHGTHDLNPARVAVLAGFESLRIGDWQRYTEIVQLYRELVEGLHDAPPLDQHEMPYLALGLPVGDCVRRQVARQAAQRVQAGLGGTHLYRPIRHADGKLRIGYLGAGFGPHPNAQLMGDIYARHDRQRFQVHAYSLGPGAGSAERQRVMERVDVFRDLAHFPAVAIAQLIVNDGIDILVDLSGYTRHARPEILALRPAPVQLSYMDFLGTQGAPWIDYALLDRHALLPEARGYWDEHIAYLPDSLFHCELPHTLPPRPARSALGLPDDALVLGALHHPRKLEPATWACWMDLLKALPQAVLWLIYETAEQQAQLIRNAEACGVPATRLVFAPMLAHEAHLTRLQQADVFIDTFIYNGHTTTIDALSAGVPVVSLCGESVVARIASGMLKAHGLPELVAHSVGEYKQIVMRLASDSAWRASMRQGVGQYSTSRLFCPEQKLAQIEAAYEMMWARHTGGQPPADFDVPV